METDLDTTIRSSGILLHPTSLPGRFGIGDFGPTAYTWIDATRPRAAKVVADPAAGPDRLRRFTLSVLLSFRRQSALDQPGTLDQGRLVDAGRSCGRPVSRRSRHFRPRGRLEKRTPDSGMGKFPSEAGQRPPAGGGRILRPTRVLAGRF